MKKNLKTKQNNYVPSASDVAGTTLSPGDKRSTKTGYKLVSELPQNVYFTSQPEISEQLDFY